MLDLTNAPDCVISTKFWTRVGDRWSVLVITGQWNAVHNELKRKSWHFQMDAEPH
jgi:hypothetical protein